MKKLTQLVWAMALVGLMMACKGPEGGVGPAGAAGPTGQQGAQGPVGPNLTGNIGGYAQLYNGVSQLKASYSGIVVSLTATTGISSDTTDANGYFELKNVRTGSYNLDFRKANHNSYTFAYTQHIGGASINLINRRETVFSLYERPSYAITSLAVSQTFTTGVTVRATPDASVGTNQKIVAYYWGADPNITYSTAPNRFYPRTNGYPTGFYSSAPEAFLSYNAGFTNSINVAKGQKVYIYAVPITPFGSLDPLTNAAGAGTFLLGDKPSAALVLTIP